MEAAEPRARKLLEAIALGLLTAFPVLPYIARLIRAPIPRFAIDGDFAGLELSTRFVTTGRTLLGPYSRFQFNHPGPAYFFFLKPVHALFGSTSNGLYAGACVLNAVAAFSLVFATRMLGKRMHAFAAALVVLAWMASFREVMAYPWNPAVIVLPVFAFLVLAAFFATGRAAAAPGAIAFAVLAMQTHLATVPTIAVVSFGAFVSFVLTMRRTRTPLTRSDKRMLGAALGIAILSSLPPLIEQVTARRGNLSKLVAFFTHSPEAPKPLGMAFHGILNAMTWLPARFGGDGIPGEFLASSEPAPSSAATTTALAWVACMIAGAVVAYRRRDRVSLAFVAVSVVATGVTILAMRGVVGTMMAYLLFWTTAVTTLGWLGFVSAVANALGDRPRAAGALVLVATLFSTSAQDKWLSDHTMADRALEPVRVTYDVVVDRMKKTGATPVVHPDGGWHIGLALLNELACDGLDARVEEHDRWIYGAQLRTPTGVSSVFHVYTQTPQHPLRTARCLERIASAEGIEVFVAPNEVSSCD